jgi:hypothetical protein
MPTVLEIVSLIFPFVSLYLSRSLSISLDLDLLTHTRTNIHLPTHSFRMHEQTFATTLRDQS